MLVLTECAFALPFLISFPSGWDLLVKWALWFVFISDSLYANLCQRDAGLSPQKKRPRLSGPSPDSQYMVWSGPWDGLSKPQLDEWLRQGMSEVCPSLPALSNLLSVCPMGGCVGRTSSKRCWRVSYCWWVFPSPVESPQDSWTEFPSDISKSQI